MPHSRADDKNGPADPDLAEHATPPTVPPVTPIATIPVNPGGEHSPPTNAQQPSHIPQESTKLPRK